MKQFYLLVIAMFCNMIFSQCEIPPNGLVSWWTGNSNTLDIIGNNDGTALAGLTYSSGVVDNAFQFDGVDDVVLVPSSTDLDITGDITIEFWARQTVFNVDNTILCKGAEDAEKTFSIRFLGATPQFVFEDNTGMDVVLTGPTFEDFQWHHYTYVRQGNQHQIYVDGFPFGSEVFTNPPASSSGLPLTIGAQFNSQNTSYVNFFGGELDEVSIYNVALTEEQIVAIYNAGSEGKCDDTASSLGYLFWGSQSSESLNYSNLDGTNETEISGGQTLIRRLCVNHTEEKVYWALPSQSRIKRSNFDGSNVEDVIVTNSQIAVIEIDELNGIVYYAENNDGTIKKCDLNGLNPQTIISGIGLVQGIAINNALNKLYWTEFDTGLLRSANLDGTNIETLLTTTDALFDLEIDPINGYLYFSNRTGNVVERIGLDGLNRTVVINASGTIGSISLDLVNNKLYWVYNDTGSSGISRASTDGTSPSTVVSSATDSFSGMDVSLGPTLLSIDSYQEELSMRLFPNPTTDFINIEVREQIGEYQNNLQLSIYDINGRRVLNNAILKSQTRVDVSTFSKGVYFYALRDQNKTMMSGKFIKN